MVWKLRYSNITSDCRYKRLSSLAEGQKCFDQPVRNNLIIYDSVQKTGTGEGDDCTTRYFLDYNYFKNDYKMMKIALSK